jgi:hypothetical protein
MIYLGIVKESEKFSPQIWEVCFSLFVSFPKPRGPSAQVAHPPVFYSIQALIYPKFFKTELKHITYVKRETFPPGKLTFPWYFSEN